MTLSLPTIGDLELALLRRGLHDISAGCERCRSCHRTPLMGERVYPVERGAILCELCRGRARETPADSRKVHGPEFGHTIRIHDNRAAA